MTSKIESTIDVNTPVSVAYNQWTQFEDFPRFMKHVESIRQLDERHLRWSVSIGGRHREFDAEIVEQIPDKRIAWRSTAGARHSGVVTFHRIDDSHTRVMLQLDFDPEGFVEKAGDMLGIVKARTHGDLDRFKEYIESRGAETGAWRGEVDQDPTR